MATPIAEFLASVGFAVDGKSLKNALTKVAAFGAAVSAAAGAALAGMIRISQAEKDLAAQADLLGVPIEKMEQLNYIAEQTGSSAEAVGRALESMAARNPRIKDASVLLERVGQNMRSMNAQAQKLYAQRMGIDPSLIPALTQDVSALRDEFAAMYGVAGRNARQAAEDSTAFLAELDRLGSMCGLLAKSLNAAFVGRMRRDIETFRRTLMENFGTIKKLFESVISIVLRIAGVVGAFVTRVVTWASALIAWYDRLSDGQKKIVVGIGAILAAWKLLNAGFLLTPIGMIVTGLTAIVALVDDYQTMMEGGESYLDWGPWAESIGKVVAALKKVWAGLVELWDRLEFVRAGFAVYGGALLDAIGPAIDAVINNIGNLFEVIGSIGDLLKAVFSGDLAAVCEAGKNLIGNLIKFWLGVFQGFIDTVAAFFASLWGRVQETFPDFAAWARGAADAIKGFFGPAVQWVKDKIRAMTDFLPGWLKDKLGLSPSDGDEQGEQTDAPSKEPPAPQPEGYRRETTQILTIGPPRVQNVVPFPDAREMDAKIAAGKANPGPWASAGAQPPQIMRPDIPHGPALVPQQGGAAQAGKDGKGQRVDINAKTEINVYGAQDPQAVGRQVAAAQNNVNADMVRYAQGAAR